MIVTTGRIIKIDVGNHHFVRTCETPGCVEVWSNGVVIRLPTNEGEREKFIAAYRRACLEAIEYRKSEFESTKTSACDHKWVLDGHNAGDPICSKCYAR